MLIFYLLFLFVSQRLRIEKFELVWLVFYPMFNLVKGGAVVTTIAGLRLDTESQTETNSDEPMQ